MATEAPAAHVGPWLVLGAVFLASVAAVMAQFAAPPVMPLLISGLGLDLGQASAIMSVFSVTGLVLALPAGLALSRFGTIATGAAAMAAVIFGSLLGAAVPSYPVLLLGRAAQGVGVGLIGVVAPAIVADAFPPRRRGAAMGIWSMWVPVGGLLMYIIAPAIAEPLGWRPVWLFVAAAGLVSLLVYVGVLGAAGATPSRSTSDALAALRRGIAIRDVWRLALVFGLASTAFGAANTFLPTFLVGERGFALADASLASSLVLVGAGIGAGATGIISDRLGSRRRVFVWASLVAAPLMPAAFLIGGAALPFALVAMGMVSGAIPSAIFASVPEVVQAPDLVPAGMAAIMVGQNGGFVAGPILFAVLLPPLGWPGTAAASGVLAIAGALVGWRARVR